MKKIKLTEQGSQKMWVNASAQSKNVVAKHHKGRPQIKEGNKMSKNGEKPKMRSQPTSEKRRTGIPKEAVA